MGVNVFAVKLEAQGVKPDAFCILFWIDAKVFLLANFCLDPHVAIQSSPGIHGNCIMGHPLSFTLCYHYHECVHTEISYFKAMAHHHF